MPAAGSPLEALHSGAGPVVYRDGSTYVVPGDPTRVDAALVEPLLVGRVTYTPSAEEAVGAVDRGEAGGAVLLRPPSVRQVQEVARRGATMPQKSTYFYPKLLSGLLFHPLEQ